MIIEFSVRGIPKGQPRPRAFSRNGRASVYNPGTAEAWKGAIALAIKPYLPPAPLEGPIRLSVEHFMPRPKAHFRTGKRAGELRPDYPVHHVSTPDVDNLAKAAMDCLTQIGVWRDDNQVCECWIKKQYDMNGTTGALIRIENI